MVTTRYAAALATIGTMAHQEGWASDGFHWWAGTPVGDFIEQHSVQEQE